MCSMVDWISPGMRTAVDHMSDPTKQSQLLDVFVTLVDTLVENYDLLDLLQTLVESCQRLLDISAAGILLVEESGELDVMASTSEASWLVEMMQLSAQAGPCIRCFTTGSIVSVPDISVSTPGWERFEQSAKEQGFAAVFAVPMRLRQTTIGALNLFRTEPGELDPQDLRAARALADVATIGILHERTLRESDAIREQLQLALNSRVLIEQAKGVVAYQRSISTEEAFNLIRSYARSNGMLLSNVADLLVQRKLSL